MSRFPWLAVSVCVFLNVLDGFDVPVMAFTGRAVSKEWGLIPGQLRLLRVFTGIGVIVLYLAAAAVLLLLRAPQTLQTPVRCQDRPPVRTVAAD